MKNKNVMKQLMLGLAMLFATKTYSQFVTTPGTSNEFMGTAAIIRGVGIGNFPAGQITDAALHINTFYMTPSSNYPGINFGEVFKTQSPSALIQAWRMFIGNGSGTQIFNIKNDNTTGSNNISLETFQNDGAIIFNTSPGAERMRIYDRNFFSAPLDADPGMVRIGYGGVANPNGFGPINQAPQLLVVGSQSSLMANGNYTVAEFRSQFTNISSAGIKIRGSRNQITNFCTAHISLSNYDDNEGTGTEFDLADLCADMQVGAGQIGFFHISTRDDANTFNSKFLIDNAGFTGVGIVFRMNALNQFNGPIRRLHVHDSIDAPQFRISQTYNTNSALGVFTDFQTTPAGDLIINPQNAAADRNVGINLSSANPPTSTLDIGGDLRIRTIIPNSVFPDVLVVDGNGLVEKRPIPAGNVIACSGLQDNYVTKVTNYLTNEISNSQIFDDGLKVGIGTNSGMTAKLNVITSLYNPGIYSEGLVYGAYGKSTGSIGSGGSINGLYGEASGASNSAGDNAGVYGIVTSSYSTAKNYGVLGKTEVTSAENTGVYGIAKNATLKNIGLKTYAQTATSTASNLGIYSEANGGGLAMAENRGVRGYAYGSTNTNAGLYGLGEGGSAAIGIHGLALNSTTLNAGVYGETYSSNATINYGVYGTAKNANISYGVYGTVPSGGGSRYGVYGDVNGTGFAVYAKGNAGGTTLWMTSDAKFKIDVTDLKDAASIIQKLQPKSYHFDTANYSFMNLPSTDQRGFISDDVELIAKDLVKTYTFPAQYDSTGKLIHESFDVKYMNYIGLIPLLVQVAQDQQQQITDLKTQVDGCCSNKMKTANDDGGSPANQVVELKTDATNYLGQSVPNPHGSQCTIPYSIDANVITAEIVFVDELGRVIQRVEIVTRGKGQLTVLSSNLEDGVYNYSLVLEGKTIDTKRMIKQH